MKNFHRMTYGNVSKALRKYLGLDFLHENTFFHPKQPPSPIYSQGVRNFWNNPLPLFIGNKGGACRLGASWGRFLSVPQLLSSPPFSYFTEKLRKPYRSVLDFHFHLFFSSLSPILSEICLPKVLGNFTEALQKPRKPWKPFLNKTWRSLPPNFFLLKQPNFQNVLEWPRFEFLFTPLSW